MLARLCGREAGPESVVEGIAITSEMIEAGVAALCEFDSFVDLGPSLSRQLVAAVLCAGVSAVSEDRAGAYRRPAKRRAPP